MRNIFHYVFSTYKRKQILHKAIAGELSSIFEDVCQKHDLKIICLNILIDHVHLLIEKPSNQSNEKVMQFIKGGSSYQLFKKFKVNRLEFRKLWGRSYRAIEIKSPEQQVKTIDYINKQKIKGIDKRFLGSRDFSRRLSPVVWSET